MALGATPARVRREVLGNAFGVTAVGAIAGLVTALAAGRLVSALLFEVRPTDPLALAGACALLILVASGAAWLPARRATKIDPAASLQSQ